ncbi:MAG TPA: polyribonucleotide nucleotidyltransferase [Opitutae bacterium]|nr:polyribonucleotide nucleotidyltransferase [Opitutae bacterium]
MKQKYNTTVESLGITFSTGTLAKQANGAVTVQQGNTSVIVTVVAAKEPKPDQSFFPLTVDYREKFSAAGRIPGGYIKREGRPSEKEILTARLCDRPLRPLFPKGFLNEVQVIGSLMSADLMHEPDILMVNGASAALMCSDIPWAGPIGCVRIGEVNGEFVVNPTNEQLFESRLDLIYVGNEKDMMMIEGSADQLEEARFLEALELAHKAIQPILAAQKELAEEVKKEKFAFTPVLPDTRIFDICKKHEAELAQALFLTGKKERENAVAAVKQFAIAAVKEVLGEENVDENHIRMAFEMLMEEAYRSNILESNKRADGRGIDDLRQISCQAGVLPVVHGSALFNRGETQALVTTTLGNSKDAQDLDAITGGASTKSFILHYNFPPFSVGEVGRMIGTNRREIGHGALAERSLLPIIPPEDDFPYSIRIISDILESNGSSSMASICGGCLALMDAGVPIIAPVAGISTGLVTQFNEKGDLEKYVVLTDILGSEDHFGDMDFKIAGTREGITGFQLDLKIKGLPLEIAKEAVLRNQEARMKILDIMAEALPEPRKELNPNAPRIHQMQIPADKIGALIGPGGKNIKRIVEVTGAQIDINEDNSGRVAIFSNNNESMEAAIREVAAIAAEIEMGKTYRGIVTSVREFGVFVECIPGKEGLVHISELADFRVERAEDVCKEGEELVVKCIGIDDKGRVRLSRKAALCEARGEEYVVRDKPREGGRDRGRRDDRGNSRGGGYDRDRGNDRRR